MKPVVYTATAADVTAGFTPPIPVDYNRVNGQYGLRYLASGGGAGTGTVQQTLDDPFNTAAASIVWDNVAVVNGRAQINGAVRAFRINTPVANDTLTVVAQGGSPAG